MASKSTVAFINTSKEVKQTMRGLSMTALRESGKVIRKILRDNIPVRSKRFKNHIGTWKNVDKKTGQPQLQVGFYGWQMVRKKRKIPSHASPHWIEHGTKPHTISAKNGRAMAYNGTVYGWRVAHPGQRATNVLRDSVYNHIDEIRAAQEEYLAELNKELSAAGVKIFEGEEEESD